jgi:hypothetical protein
MTVTATESTFEEATIARLLAQGYRYQRGSTIDRSPQSVLLIPELRAYLQRRYRHLPAHAIELIRAPDRRALSQRAALRLPAQFY